MPILEGLAFRERTAFALFLYTGQRRSDVVRMAWTDLAGDAIKVVQLKTGARLTIRLHPELKQILRHWPRSHTAILTTVFGRPFSVAGFGNMMADAIRAAGLSEQCVPHGLRRAAARRLAEAGCSEKQIAALTGHTTLKEVARYTWAANQERLAADAVNMLTEQNTVKNSQTGGGVCLSRRPIPKRIKKQISRPQNSMSALPPIADIR